MKPIENKLNTPCSVEGCNSLYIYRKKDWKCEYHVKMEYKKNSKQGRKNWNAGNKKPIRKVSKKRAIENAIYKKTRIEFLSRSENKYCAVLKNRLSTEVHHAKGRIGDLFLNTEFWIAVSSEGHKYIHENDSWSRKNGFLLSRIT